MRSVACAPVDAMLAKVKRAEAHIAELDEAIKRLMSSPQKPYRIEGQHDRSGKRFEFWGYSKDVPPDLSLMAGDAVHNLRSSLDHMMWALAEKNGVPHRSVQFVGRTKASDFRKDRQALRCIGSAALQILEKLQPYHATSPLHSPLYVLTELSNRDKHRLLIAVGARSTLGPALRAVEVPGVPIPDPPGFDVCGMSAPRVVAMTANGVVLFTVDLGRPAPHIAFEMDFDVELALIDAGSLARLGAVDALLELRDVVLRTLMLFEPLL
jgi:hypothetical protein